ncbi:hypothetical protein [Algivirga pacifica]|uniref:Uncharacterized protein n=1 Tax=Algivirga pacifica TaxID=1162670 RepID=A0ABP9DB93_9BACT
MRKKLSQTELKQLKKEFPQLKQIAKGLIEVEPQLFVSPFEHWLSIEECHAIYDQSKNPERRQYNENLLQLIFEYSDGQLYTWRFKRRERVYFYRITSLAHLIKLCDVRNKSWESGCRFHIISPALKVIYEEHWDWTNIFNLFEGADKDIIEKLVKEAGLYVTEVTDDC